MTSLACLVVLSLVSQAPKEKDRDTPAKPRAHAVVPVEGWTVYVDERLRSGPGEPLGRKALGLLEAQLRVIAATLPEAKVKRLQQVAIQLDQTHGTLVSPQYHPNPDWLREHGYAETLGKRVHIPDATYFVRSQFQHQQPSAVLHELAHAYHDQVLGFDSATIREAWQSAKKSGRLDLVLHINGTMSKHYALTNPQEFFAEMTEAHLGHNDFYPFSDGELKKSEPEIHALLKKIWGQ